MSRVSKFVLFALLSAVGLTSCLDDDKHEWLHMKECWGTVIGTQNEFKIVTDLGNTLMVVENGDPSFQVEDSMRVVANFTELEQKGENVYDIRINAMRQLLTKDPLYSSQLNEQQVDSVGYDPIEMLYAWFGGPYLNIEFGAYFSDMQKAHMLNLVVDEERSTDERVYVTLTHNAFGDARMYRGYGRVSFNIADLLPEGKDQIVVVLGWTDYAQLPQPHRVISDTRKTKRRSKRILCCVRDRSARPHLPFRSNRFLGRIGATSKGLQVDSKRIDRGLCGAVSFMVTTVLIIGAQGAGNSAPCLFIQPTVAAKMY